MMISAVKSRFLSREFARKAEAVDLTPKIRNLPPGDGVVSSEDFHASAAGIATDHRPASVEETLNSPPGSPRDGEGLQTSGSQAGVGGKVAEGVGNSSGDSGASYRFNPAPRYPQKARRLRHEGLVVLRAKVSGSGKIDGLRVAATSGFPELDAAAEQTVWKWRFNPAMQEGRPVGSEVEVPIRFSLSHGTVLAASQFAESLPNRHSDDVGAPQK